MSIAPGHARAIVVTKEVEGRTTWIADAHCGDGQRFMVRAGEKLTAFVELETGTISEEN